MFKIFSFFSTGSEGYDNFERDDEETPIRGLTYQDFVKKVDKATSKVKHDKVIDTDQ